MLQRAQGNPLMEANVVAALAGLKAMRGEFEEARELGARSERAYERLGLRLAIANAAEVAGTLELLAGDAAAAERAFRRGYEIFSGVGGGVLSFHASLLAVTLFAQARYDEADELARTAEAAARDDDVGSQVRWRGIRARLEARTGRRQAEQLAREAVTLAETTDASNLHADALADLAAVLRASDREGEAAVALREAVELYDRKGNLVSRKRSAALLGERMGETPQQAG